MRDGRIRLVLAGVLCVGLLALSIGEASLLAPGAAPREAADNPQGARAGAKAGGPAADAAKGEKLTLDRIFPEKSFFGPGARSMTFSRDGRFAAFLYRPYAERRHGNDLYVHDTVTGDTRRITSVGRMAQYQAEARKVQEDREKKAKKAGVSLSLLAREQYQAMGWTEGLIVGDWDGQATGGGAAIAPGACEVEFNERAAGGFAGQVRIGLVRLLLKSVEVNEAAATVKGKIDDEALKVKGELSLTLTGGELRGDLKLTQPEEALTLTLTRRAPAEPDKAKTGPLGVLGAIGERLTLADVVLADDAEINDDKDGTPVKERAPRYGGVASIEWSPTKHEMLLLAEGEIFLLTIDPTEWETPMTPPKLGAPVEGPPPAKEEAPDPGAPGDKPEDDEQKEDGAQEEKAEKDDKVVEEDKADAQPEGEKPAADAKPKSTTPKKPSLAPVTPYRGELTRLTRTRERETDVQYLPDGSGYTYLRSGALLRVSFGDHQIMQLDPELKDGERMVGYRISPDKRRLVFLANRGQTTGSRARQVTIVNYRDRFARAQDVSRHMPDDPWPESYTSVYLYDLRGHEKEDGKLERVFTRRVNGPRDVMRVPEWSPDSSLVAFAAYDQQTGHMKILEAGFKTEKKPGEPAKATEPPSTPPADQREDGAKNDDTQQDAPKTEEKKEEEPEFKIENARVVYQFLHHGGPNTPGLVQPQYLPDSRRMVFITELSGFRQLHMLEPRYEQLTQVTSGKFELFPFYISKDNTTLFATSSEGDPNQEHVVKIDLQTLEATRLTSAPGVYREAAVRDDGSLVLAMHVDFGAPGELVMVRPGAEPTQTALTDSHPEEAHKLTKALPEYFTYENRHGQTIHGHMFKPADWTPADKRPLLIYVYGGPLQSFNKMATRGSYSAPSYFFARYMAENHGYVAVTIDPRGASGYGAVFEKANFEQVGKPQTEDLVDGARWLVKHHGVDEKRMAMHGWSFGGFQTQMVMYTEPDVFAAGIAGAGPTEWHNYNSWYSTGTIGSNQPGKTDLEKYSLLPLAKNLKGKLLLVHGVEDSNVLYQDTVRVYRELLKANKEVNVELFIDPTGGHGLGGDVKTIGRYRKYEDFLLRTVGKGEATKASEAKPDDEAARPEGEAKPDGGEAKTP